MPAPTSRGSTTPRARGAGRGRAQSFAGSVSRGSTAGTGRGASQTTATAPPSNPANPRTSRGLLNKLRRGDLGRGAANGLSLTPSSASSRNGSQHLTSRGASTGGRGSTSRRSSPGANTFTKPGRDTAVSPSGSHDPNAVQARYEQLNRRRTSEREQAIADGLLADPNKRTTLAQAITPVGTCVEMCPLFERVQRMRELAVDPAEKVVDDETGRSVPLETRMVKRFRRAAAGNEEQLPSDIRTPTTLRGTLDYLLDEVVGGGQRLATVEKFVWDRTRAIRNDFSIQQVSKAADVQIAVECYERIARFHILALHQLSNPDNLQDGERFDAHQEREQLNNTLLSLMYYYDDHRHLVRFPNEAEFRAYGILFEIQSPNPDMEDRMQTWPKELLLDPRVQTARKLFAAAGNTVMDQGPLRPYAPFSVAQANPGHFWTILDSQQVPYLMACVAEINFALVRFTALDAIWRATKVAPKAQQSVTRSWTLSALTEHLGFDDHDQTAAFCEALDVPLKSPGRDGAEDYVDFTAHQATALDSTAVPNKQLFSREIVEAKRYNRTLPAVINGVGVADAIRRGLVVQTSANHEHESHVMDTAGDEDSMMFVTDDRPQRPAGPSPSSTPPLGLNPHAVAFKPFQSFGTHTPSGLNDARPDTSATNASGSVVGETGFTSSSPSSGFLGQKPLQQSSGDSITLEGGSSDTAAEPNAPSFAFGKSGFGDLPKQNVFGQSASAFTADAPPSVTSPSPAPTVTESAPAVQKANSQPGLFQWNQAPRPSASGPQNALSVTKPVSTPTASNPFIFPAAPTPPKPTLTSTTPAGSPNVSVMGTDSTTFSSFKPPSTGQVVHATGTEKQEQTSAQGETSQVNRPVFPGFLEPLRPSQAQEPSQPTAPLAKKTTTPAANTSATNPVFQFTQPTATPSSSQNQLKLPASEQATAVQQPPSDFTARTAVQAAADASQSRSGDNTASSTPSTSVEETMSLSGRDTTRVSSTSSNVALPHEAGPPSTQPRPTEPEFAEIDRERLVHNTALIGLTQRDGIMDMFVSHVVSNIVHKLFTQVQEKNFNSRIEHVKTQHLSRKYFAVWKETADRRRFRKKVDRRRKMFATSVMVEEQKQRKQEQELEQIKEAVNFTRRIQEFQRERRRTGPDAGEGQQDAALNHAARAGLKRKPVTSSPGSSILGGPGSPREEMTKTHKRSRTLGSSTNLDGSNVVDRSESPLRLPSPHHFSSSTTKRPPGSFNDLTRPSSKPRLDQTQTDYFRLKAMGIDPDTPLIPDTAKSMAAKQQRMEADRQQVVARTIARPSLYGSSLRRSLLTSATEASTPTSQPRPVEAAVEARSVLSAPSPQSQPTATGEEDDLLRQLREARQAMAENTDWFRQQTLELEREVRQREDAQTRASGPSINLKVTLSQPGSRGVIDTAPNLATSQNGLSRSSYGGLEYLAPPHLLPGQTLSRTEQRIRLTGARGFATRSVDSDPSVTGSTPGSTTGYVPVAMSKRSAREYRESARKLANEVTKDQRSALTLNLVDETRVRNQDRGQNRGPNGRQGNARVGATMNDPPMSTKTSQKPFVSNGRSRFSVLMADDDEKDEEDEENDLEEGPITAAPPVLDPALDRSALAEVDDEEEHEQEARYPRDGHVYSTSSDTGEAEDEDEDEGGGEEAEEDEEEEEELEEEDRQTDAEEGRLLYVHEELGELVDEEKIVDDTLADREGIDGDEDGEGDESGTEDDDDDDGLTDSQRYGRAHNYGYANGGGFGRTTHSQSQSTSQRLSRASSNLSGSGTGSGSRGSYSAAATPNSGLGATEEDAIELSD